MNAELDSIAQREHDIPRLLMAVAHVVGAWNREMLLPAPNRPLLIRRREDGNWDLDQRGYPLPSEAFLLEIYYLYTMEQSRNGVTPPA